MWGRGICLNADEPDVAALLIAHPFAALLVVRTAANLDAGGASAVEKKNRETEQDDRD
jgi:hypothetical protein